MKRSLLAAIALVVSSCGLQTSLRERAVEECLRAAGVEDVNVDLAEDDGGWFNYVGGGDEADADEIARCIEESR